MRCASGKVFCLCGRGSDGFRVTLEEEQLGGYQQLSSREQKGKDGSEMHPLAERGEQCHDCSGEPELLGSLEGEL